MCGAAYAFRLVCRLSVHNPDWDPSETIGRAKNRIGDGLFAYPEVTARLTRIGISIRIWAPRLRKPAPKAARCRILAVRAAFVPHQVRFSANTLLQEKDWLEARG